MMKQFAAIVSTVLVALSISPAQPGSTISDQLPWSVKQLVDLQMSIHKNLSPQDVYKMLYQANFGAGHSVIDSAAVLAALQKEMASLDTNSSKEELIERISADNNIVRVNLRPFKAMNLNPELLARAICVSVKEFTPDTQMFFRQWGEFRSMVRYGLIPMSVQETESLSKEMDNGGVAPVHHSAGYATANHPAYRVVLKTVFDNIPEK